MRPRLMGILVFGAGFAIAPAIGAPYAGKRAMGTLHSLALMLCLGLCLEAGAADVFVNRITTFAQVERSERNNGPGAVLTLVDQDFAGGIDIDAYARLDDDNTAYQSYSGFNAVRVQDLIENAYPQNYLAATTNYTISVTTVGDTLQALYLDYLVFPGVVGLQAFGSVGERARVTFDVNSLTPGLGVGFPMGAQGQVMLERVQRGLGTTLVSTIDPVFLNAGAFTQGIAEVSGMRVNTIETQPFLATAFLGVYEPLTVVEIAYRMSASITIPGYETAAIARLGDPFSLRADTQAEIDKHFAGSPVPFRVRAETVTPVPEPGAWLMLLAGMAVMALRRTTRGRAPATIAPCGGR